MMADAPAEESAVIVRDLGLKLFEVQWRIPAVYAGRAGFILYLEFHGCVVTRAPEAKAGSR